MNTWNKNTCHWKGNCYWNLFKTGTCVGLFDCLFSRKCIVKKAAQHIHLNEMIKCMRIWLYVCDVNVIKGFPSCGDLCERLSVVLRFFLVMTNSQTHMQWCLWLKWQLIIIERMFVLMKKERLWMTVTFLCFDGKKWIKRTVIPPPHCQWRDYCPTFFLIKKRWDNCLCFKW